MGVALLKLFHKIMPNSSILFRWIASYIIILFSTLVISGFVYMESIKIIENFVDKALLDSLHQFRLYIDERLMDMERLSMEVSFDKKVKMIISKDSSLEPYERYSLLDIRDKLSSYKNANGFIDTVFIYFPKLGSVLNNDGLYDIDDWYKLNYSTSDLSYDKFLELYNSLYKNDYKVFSDLKRKNKPNKDIFIVRPLSSGYSNKPDAVFVLVVNDQAIIESMKKSVNASQSTFFTLDKNDNVLFSNNMDYINVNYSSLLGSSGKRTLNSTGKELMLSYVNSNIADWKYISIIPTTVFSKKLDYIKNLIIICVLISLIFGLWIAYLFSSKNYKSIGKIISLFTKNQNGTKVNLINEYEYIESSVRSVIDENEKIYATLDQQKNTLKNFFLTRLIKGNIDNEVTANNLCHYYKIPFKGYNFQTILFYIEEFSDTFLKNDFDKSSSEATLIIICDFIKNSLEDLEQNNINIFIVQADEAIACLIDSKNENLLLGSIDIKAIALKCKERCQNELGVFLSISISSVHNKVNMLKNAYNEALETLEYIHLIGSNEVTCYNQINKHNGMNSTLIHSSYEKYKNLLTMRDFEGAKAVFSEVFDAETIKYSSSLQLLKYKIFSFIDMMLDAMRHINIPNSSNVLDEMKIMGKLLKCKSIIELKTESEYLLDYLAKTLKESEDCQQEDLTTRIRDYVYNNYDNKNLSVAMIAENMNISASYLTRYFKKQTGITVIELIQQTRILKAKDLIENQNDLNISEIADKTGFYNSIALIRVFKKREGITPGKYKLKS
jgi:two-component system, response regulator YesN